MKIKESQYILSFLLLIALLGGCRMEENLIEPQSFPGPDFIDIENDGYVVILGAQEPAAGLTGTWKIFNGENGRLEEPVNPKTRFLGEPGETYLLGWEVRNADQYRTETITVSFKELNPVITTQVIDTVYNNVSLILEAEKAKFGAQGAWQIVKGDGGRIENNAAANTIFVGKAHAQYTLEWSLSYGSKMATRQISFITDELVADAGEDQLDIKTSDEITKFYNLKAVLPPGATAEWELLNGGQGRIYSSADPHSIFEGVADSIYTLLWTVNLDQYQSVDTLQLRFRGKWGLWTDNRDGQSYRYVEINGLEWMAENFNYNYNSAQGRSWYYGQSARAFINMGYPVESVEDRKHFGRLYNWIAADEAVPEGWRLPTNEDFANLENYFGGPSYAGPALAVGGESGLDLNHGGYVSYADGSTEQRDYYSDLENIGYFWTANYDPNRYEASAQLLGNTGKSSLFDLSFHVYYFGISVRYVRDAQ